MIKPKVTYKISDFSKEDLEQQLIGKVVRFWTKDCTIMPDFDIVAPVVKVSYFNNGEVSIGILKHKTGRQSKIIQLSTRMKNLKFVVLAD